MSNDNHEMLCYDVIDLKEVDCEREALAIVPRSGIGH